MLHEPQDLPGLSCRHVFGAQVMQTLKDLANEGKTVVCSIHQPRSSIFSMFDDLLLLSEGEVIYSGPAKGIISHFESLVRSRTKTLPVRFHSFHSIVLIYACKSERWGKPRRSIYAFAGSSHTCKLQSSRIHC